MRLDELRTQALRYVALGDFAHALQVYEQMIRAVPSDLDARMRVADVCAQIGQRDLARRVYATVTFYDLQAGRPLHALVAMQALAELGEEIGPLREAMAQLYGAGSNRIAVGKVGSRLAPPSPATAVEPPDLSRPRELEAAALAAVAVAADTRSLTNFPEQFPPVPLLSELSDRAFARVFETAAVLRLAHGTPIIRQGDRGDSFYLLAAGEVRVYLDGPGGEQTELARLHEGALFGEMALVHAQPRSASIDVIGSADVLAFGRLALRAAADELPAVAGALERFTRDRLLKNVLTTSPLFRPFTPQQRVDLLRRFSSRDCPGDTEIVREGDEATGLHVLLIGEVEVSRGEPPFDTVLATLGPGECFGEMSLLSAQRAVATVRTTRPSTVLFLARHYFERLTAAMPEVRAMFEQMSEERLRSLPASDQPTDETLF